MAQRHDEFLAVGARVVGISVDTPGQQAAMVEKLALPFPLLSDPDRSGAIEPYGVANPEDPREIAIPSMFLIAPDGTIAWSFVSRDFADRSPEDEVIVATRQLDLPSTTQPAPLPGTPDPGPGAMPLHGLSFYLRGARFAALAMGLRHRSLGEAIADDSKAYVAQMDRYLEAVKTLRQP